MTKNRILTIRFSDDEYNFIEDTAHELDISKAEVVRRLHWIARVLLSDNLMLRNGILDIDNIDRKKRVLYALHNIPELLIIMIEKGMK